MRSCLLALPALLGTLYAADLPVEWKEPLNRISARSLEAHVSFLAADALAGRDTPSPGLAAAAAYIASRFRGAGLELPGPGDYYQTAQWVLRKQAPESMELTIRTEASVIRAASSQLGAAVTAPLLVQDVSATVAPLREAANLEPESTDGKVVVVTIPDSKEMTRQQRQEMFESYRRFSRMISSRDPALVLYVEAGRSMMQRFTGPRLIDREEEAEASPPVMVISDPAIHRTLQRPKGEIRISAACDGPVEQEVKLRNVVGILRGSDPALRETAVLLTAHYDHIGTKPSGDGDRIFNGANDDASGAAAIVEIAEALAPMKIRPRRSIVFVAYFGEEKGLLGSGYYARHPVFPLARTVANINLEQVGRTDSSEGPQIRRASVTGIDYSEVGTLVREAGEATGIEIYKHEKNNDPFFLASDNFSLAKEGVPAHSLSTAYMFPDYHGVGDHWDKIDYDNMAAVTKAVAAAALLIADREEAPRWNESNEKAKPFLEAWRNLQNEERPDGGP